MRGLYCCWQKRTAQNGTVLSGKITPRKPLKLKGLDRLKGCAYNFGHENRLRPRLEG
jgi:hypothetical protein